MNDDVLLIHGTPGASPLVLDSPHSGTRFPADFGSVLSEDELRDGEDSFIDALWQPAVGQGAVLLAAQFPRTYLDPNRHAADIDPALLAEPWPFERFDSGKAAIGKALVWRTMDADKPIYDRRLTVAELQRRIERFHRPYHEALARLIDAAHAAHGLALHVNCHSMGPNTSLSIEGVEGRPRADFVLGDRDGSTCDPAFTDFVRRRLVALGYDVKVNDPFKGVELVRAHADPARGRHSLQLEINKRLYMHDDRIERHAGFDRLQRELMDLLAAVRAELVPALTESTHG